jgi:hypothetical protein
MSNKIKYEEIKAFLEDQPRIILASFLPLKKLEVDNKGIYWLTSPVNEITLTTTDLRHAVNQYNKL